MDNVAPLALLHGGSAVARLALRLRLLPGVSPLLLHAFGDCDGDGAVTELAAIATAVVRVCAAAGRL